MLVAGNMQAFKKRLLYGYKNYFSLASPQIMQYEV